MFQMTEQDKISEEVTEVEISNLLSKELKAMIIKVLKELKRRMDEQSEKLEVFNKELENIKKNQTELKYTITEIKDILERINSRLNDTEEWFSKLEDQGVEITEAEQKKKNKTKMKTV